MALDKVPVMQSLTLSKVWFHKQLDGWPPGNFEFQNHFVQRHLAATDCSMSTDCAELTALIRPEPLMAWIVRDSLCPKLANWSSSARIAFLRQTQLRPETNCFPWWTDLFIFFIFFKHWFFNMHWLRDSVSPLCGFFFYCVSVNLVRKLIV